MVTGSVRLVVDAACCDGHGICALRCPELISLDEWGFAVVVPGAIPDARLLRRARRAVAACPRRALSLNVVEPPDRNNLPHDLVCLPERVEVGPRDPRVVRKVHNRSNG